MLDGSNWAIWNQQMTSYLMSQGLYRILAQPCPKEVKDATTKEVLNEEAINKWEEANSKAVGSIRLRLHGSIAYKHRATIYASTLIHDIETEYGKPGVAGIFLEFKKLMDLKIPNNTNPSITINQFFGHISKLEEEKVVLAPDLQSLILLSKIPPSYSNLTQQLSQVEAMANLMKTDKMRRQVMIAWEQRSSRQPQNQNQNQAQKLSNVQHAPQEPGFQQQQQQGTGGRGRTC